MAEEKQAASASAEASASADKKATASQEELKKQLEECEKRATEYLSGWQRERADLLNYKKEELERVGELIKYADVGIILKILPILDNFEIAEKKLPESLRSDENVKGFLQIKTQIRDFLRSQGVEEIKSVGEKFDPRLHEIVGEVEPSEVSLSPDSASVAEATSAEEAALAKGEAKEGGKKAEPGTIIEEIQKGYKIDDRLLRPAKVSVMK